MALKIKLLKVLGLTSNTDTVLYAPASGKSALIKNITFTNTGSSPVSVNLSVSSAAATVSSPAKFKASPSFTVAAGTSVIYDNEVTLIHTDDLSTGTVDNLYYTSNGALDCVLNGLERDL